MEVVVEERTEYLPYFRTSWSPTFRPMRTSRSKVDRSYRDPRLLYELIREFGYSGPIIMFLARSPELGRFAADLLAEGSAVEQALAELERSLAP